MKGLWHQNIVLFAASLFFILLDYPYIFHFEVDGPACAENTSWTWKTGWAFGKVCRRVYACSFISGTWVSFMGW